MQAIGLGHPTRRLGGWLLIMMESGSLTVTGKEIAAGLNMTTAGTAAMIVITTVTGTTTTTDTTGGPAVVVGSPLRFFVVAGHAIKRCGGAPHFGSGGKGAPPGSNGLR